MPRKLPESVPVPLELSHPLAARILADPDLAVWLKPFMHSAMSLKCAADELKIPIQTLHYRAEQMVEAGLLKVEREEARRGRPVKFYKATARAFEVPLELVPPGQLRDLENALSWKRAFEQGVNKALGRSGYERYLRVHLGEDGIMNWGDWEKSNETLFDDFPAVFDRWGVFRLSRKEAKALQKELSQVYEKYAHRRGDGRYVMHLGLAPHPNDG